MAKTNWQDPKSSEIRSTHISGLQEAVGKLEESIGLETVAETDIPLTEVFISNDDRCRIYQAPEGKRNWLSSPAPVIKKNGVVITDDFEIDYGGGAVIFTTPISESDIVTADATYTKKIDDKQLEILSNKIDNLAGEGRTTETVKGNADKIGDLSTLKTNAKSDLVNAINEVKDNIDDISLEAENVSYNNTDSGLEASNVQAAIDEVKDELDAHKAEIATENTLGHVMVDGDTITITPNGVIRAEGSRFNPDLSYVRIGQNATTTTETDVSIGSNALSNGISESSGDHFGAIAIGEHSEGRNASSIAIGMEALASGNISIALGRSASATSSLSIALGRSASAIGSYATALGPNSRASGSHAIALGRGASAEGDYAIALGRGASAEGDYSVALGYYVLTENANEGVLGEASSKWKVPGSFTVSGTKNFEIPHPKPEKKATHVIRHGAVESPTPGDTLYRWRVQASKDNDLVTIDLPDYFVWLNKDVQIFVTPQGHFGNGYGELNRETEQLEIHCQFAGEYNVLVIGTRNDDHPSVQEWYIKGVEREIGESWTGETYAFSVDEIIEIEEIKEVSA